MNLYFKNKLDKLKASFSYRSLKLAEGVDFSSNDYLGLSNHPKIKEVLIKSLQEGISVGSGGSRLLRGNHKAHIELEEYAADFFKVDKSLFFSSGFLANYAVLTTLADRHDVIIFDELVHASMRDGLNACFAKKIKVKHNNVNDLELAIQKAQNQKAKNIWVALESVYSMDGDFSDLDKVLELINRYENCYLIYDEAHATGIFGPNGHGLSEGYDHKKIISIHTCGKAIGVSGALVCGGSEIIDYLINKARPFIFTTAESPLIAIAVKKALEIIDSEPWRRKQLLELVAYTNKAYLEAFKEEPYFQSQIIPIILNENSKAVKVAAYLQSKGFDIRAIRPPTVPTARLRLSLNVNHTKDDINRVFSELRYCLDQILQEESKVEI